MINEMSKNPVQNTFKLSYFIFSKNKLLFIFLIVGIFLINLIPTSILNLTGFSLTSLIIYQATKWVFTFLTGVIIASSSIYLGKMLLNVDNIKELGEQIRTTSITQIITKNLNIALGKFISYFLLFLILFVIGFLFTMFMRYIPFNFPINIDYLVLYGFTIIFSIIFIYSFYFLESKYFECTTFKCSIKVILNIFKLSFLKKVCNMKYFMMFLSLMLISIPFSILFSYLDFKLLDMTSYLFVLLSIVPSVFSKYIIEKN